METEDKTSQLVSEEPKEDLTIKLVKGMVEKFIVQDEQKTEKYENRISVMQDGIQSRTEAILELSTSMYDHFFQGRKMSNTSGRQHDIRS